jgi:UDP-N-acetylmuramoyl-tripeptide--D-alanyl-D-alanine ligase
MTALWTSREAAAATGGRATRAFRATGVSIDSRTVAKGDLFVALAGPNFDGHEFAADALKRGAAAAMVARVPDGVRPDAPLLVVDGTMAGLEALGSASRARMRGRIVAVTGSAGKTGVKEAIRHCLARRGETAASEGSLNNQWGVPLSLARMQAGAVFGVFEAGMNHAGEIARLTRLIRPHVAVITNIEPAHVAYFDSLDAIADAKAEIFEGVEAGGAAVLNRDSPQYARLAARAAREPSIERIISFGRDASADVRLVDATAAPEASEVTASLFGREITYRVGLPGPHWQLNSLTVLAAIAALDEDAEAAAAALADLAALPGRGARRRIRVAGGTATLIDDSYNAKPASMCAAIATLAAARPGKGGRRIAVLGDMRELGAESGALHVGLARPLTEHRIDLVFAAGEEMAKLFAALPCALRGAHAETADALAPLVADALRPGDVVMVKGSHASGMHTVVAYLDDGADGGRTPRRRAANG